MRNPRNPGNENSHSNKKRKPYKRRKSEKHPINLLLLPLQHPTSYPLNILLNPLLLTQEVSVNLRTRFQVIHSFRLRIGSARKISDSLVYHSQARLNTINHNREPLHKLSSPTSRLRTHSISLPLLYLNNPTPPLMLNRSQFPPNLLTLRISHSLKHSINPLHLVNGVDSNPTTLTTSPSPPSEKIENKWRFISPYPLNRLRQLRLPLERVVAIEELQEVYFRKVLSVILVKVATLSPRLEG